MSNAEHLDNALAKSELHVLPEAGHLASADQSDEFSSMIIAWVAAGDRHTAAA